MFGLSGFWTMAPLRYAAKFDPFLSLDCAPTPSTLAQAKERKGSNFAIWQSCKQDVRGGIHFAADGASVVYAAGCGVALFDSVSRTQRLVPLADRSEGFIQTRIKAQHYAVNRVVKVPFEEELSSVPVPKICWNCWNFSV